MIETFHHIFLGDCSVRLYYVNIHSRIRLSYSRLILITLFSVIIRLRLLSIVEMRSFSVLWNEVAICPIKFANCVFHRGSPSLFVALDNVELRSIDLEKWAFDTSTNKLARVSVTSYTIFQSDDGPSLENGYFLLCWLVSDFREFESQYTIARHYLKSLII